MAVVADEQSKLTVCFRILLANAGSCLLYTSARWRLFFSSFFHRAATLGADADNAKQMLRYLKPVLGSHRILNPFQLCRKEFDYSATLRADHVVVMLMLVVMFVVCSVVAEADLAREPGL
jgi:hypothetical protein